MSHELKTQRWIVTGENVTYRLNRAAPEVVKTIQNVTKRAIGLARTVEPVLKVS